MRRVLRLLVLLGFGSLSLRRNARLHCLSRRDCGTQAGGGPAGGVGLRNLPRRGSPGWLGRPRLHLPRVVPLPCRSCGQAARAVSLNPIEIPLPKLRRCPEDSVSHAWGIIGVTVSSNRPMAPPLCFPGATLAQRGRPSRREESISSMELTKPRRVL